MRTQPEVVLDTHRKYLETGSDVIETNSFGSSAAGLGEYGLAADAHELSRRAAELACQATQEFATPAKPRFVAGSMETCQDTRNIKAALLAIQKFSKEIGTQVL